MILGALNLGLGIIAPAFSFANWNANHKHVRQTYDLFVEEGRIIELQNEAGDDMEMGRFEIVRELTPPLANLTVLTVGLLVQGIILLAAGYILKPAPKNATPPECTARPR